MFSAQLKFASGRHSFISAHDVFFAEFNVFTQLFATSIERWNILNTHVPDFTLHPLPETRRECRLRSVKRVRFQLLQIRDALEASKSTKDTKIKSEAQSLAENEFSFEFILAAVVWYELLSAIDEVRKSVQSRGADLSMAVTLLKELLRNFRKKRFTSLKETALKLSDENETPLEFKRTSMSTRTAFTVMKDTIQGRVAP
jgi:hypothetical protein